MPRIYPKPDKQTAWERVKRALTIYSRVPGVDIDSIEAYIEDEEKRMNHYIAPPKLSSGELAFAQLSKYYVSKNMLDWKAYWRLRNKCSPDDQEWLDDYTNNKPIEEEEQ